MIITISSGNKAINGFIYKTYIVEYTATMLNKRTEFLSENLEIKTLRFRLPLISHKIYGEFSEIDQFLTTDKRPICLLMAFYFDFCQTMNRNTVLESNNAINNVIDAIVRNFSDPIILDWWLDVLTKNPLVAFGFVEIVDSFMLRQ